MLSYEMGRECEPEGVLGGLEELWFIIMTTILFSCKISEKESKRRWEVAGPGRIRDLKTSCEG